jgi:hypothetical protein
MAAADAASCGAKGRGGTDGSRARSRVYSARGIAQRSVLCAVCCVLSAVCCARCAASAVGQRRAGGGVVRDRGRWRVRARARLGGGAGGGGQALGGHLAGSGRATLGSEG